MRRLPFVMLALVLAALCTATLAGDSAPPDADVPVIESVTPNSVELGKSAEIVIRGRGFSTDKARPAEVYVGDSKASYCVVMSESEIHAIVPAMRKAARVQIEVRNPDRQSAVADFYYGPASAGIVGGLSRRLANFSAQFRLGGPTMYAILALSVLGLAWFIHCLIYLRPSRLVSESFTRRLVALLSGGDLGEAQKVCESDRSLLSRVALAGIRRAGESPQKVAEAIEAAGAREAATLFQKVSYLSNVGVISPMLGLFGTVLGMITVFGEFATGNPQQAKLAQGVSEALYTTAFGLIVGIPAMCAYYYLRGRVVRIVTDLEEEAEEVVRALHAERS